MTVPLKFIRTKRVLGGGKLLIGNCFFKAKIQVACGPRVGWGAKRTRPAPSRPTRSGQPGRSPARRIQNPLQISIRHRREVGSRNRRLERRPRQPGWAALAAGKKHSTYSRFVSSCRCRGAATLYGETGPPPPSFCGPITAAITNNIHALTAHRTPFP